MDGLLGEVMIIRKPESIHVIVHMPKTEAGKAELSERVARIHADAVIQRIKTLDCPDQQKFQLLDAVIRTAKERERDEPER